MKTHLKKQFIGEQLRKAIDNKGSTISELSTAINRSRTIIYKYLNNKKTPSVETLDKISNFFNLPPEYFTNKMMNSKKRTKRTDDELLLDLENQIKAIEERKKKLMNRERELVNRQKEKERKRINKKIFAVGRAIYNEYETNEETKFLDLDQEKLIQKVRIGQVFQVAFQEEMMEIDPNLLAKYIGQYHKAIIDHCMKFDNDQEN